MVFSSLVFLCIFLPVVFLVYQVLPGMKSKNALLIVASLVFYAYGEPIYVLLMIVSTVVNYALGLWIGPVGANRPRRLGLVIAVIVNIGVLVFFKYTDMIVLSVNGLLGTAIAQPQIKLPIGISFFTFQALSYVIDVYRGEADPQRNYTHVLLYIAFFPQLIAGPIIKYHDIDDQICERTVSTGDIAYGLRRFTVGLAKKVLIANVMAVAADALFALAPDQLNIFSAWLAAFAYLLQIYFDFSGYSDMAIGMGRMFGFTFKENFDYPYVSCTIKEFWRRWHISLSTWFKEYLYIPLGGNRKGRPRAVLNKLIVFFLCGLWHGAAWTFVFWGLYHGFFLLLEEYLPLRKLPKALGHIYALLVVTVGFVVFRATSIAQAFGIIHQMFLGFNFQATNMAVAMGQLSPLFCVTLVIGFIAMTPVRDIVLRHLRSHDFHYRRRIENISFVCSFLLIVFCLLSLSSGAYNPFIYFRF